MNPLGLILLVLLLSGGGIGYMGGFSGGYGAGLGGGLGVLLLIVIVLLVLGRL